MSICVQIAFFGTCTIKYMHNGIYSFCPILLCDPLLRHGLAIGETISALQLERTPAVACRRLQTFGSYQAEFGHCLLSWAILAADGHGIAFLPGIRFSSTQILLRNFALYLAVQMKFSTHLSPSRFVRGFGIITSFNDEPSESDFWIFPNSVPLSVLSTLIINQFHFLNFGMNSI